MSRFSFLASLSLLLSIVGLPTSSAFSLGAGTCTATANAVNSNTGKHPITPQLGFYLSGLPVQYALGTKYQVTIVNTGRNPNVTSFNGFLLYAQDANGNRQGSWETSNAYATTDMAWAVEATAASNGQYQCGSNSVGTITHNSAGVKKAGSLSIAWTAPSTNVGSLTWNGLVETSLALQYTQVLTPWTQCSPNTNTCTAFNPASLPTGSLPVPSTAGGTSPFGLAPVDKSSCGNFSAFPNAAVPAGFCASLYATVNRPRSMYVTDRGDLLVVETAVPTGVSLLRDLNGDGSINGTGEYTRILTAPSLNHGLYVHGGWMYYSSPNFVWRLPFDSLNPTAVLSQSLAQLVVKNMPNGGHTTRTPLVSHDGKWLYMSVGSGSNLDTNELRARVLRYDLTQPIPQGGYQWNNYSAAVQTFGLGLRNAVGLTLDLSGDVWSVMNGDDNLNRTDLGGYNIHNDNPADRLDHLLASNQASGWYGCQSSSTLSRRTVLWCSRRASSRSPSLCFHRVSVMCALQTRTAGLWTSCPATRAAPSSRGAAPARTFTWTARTTTPGAAPMPSRRRTL